MRGAITQNGITYFPGQGPNWLGTDGKKYVRRGPLDGTQSFYEINNAAPYTAMDAGDAMDGGAGFTDTETRIGQGGLPQTGRNLGPKPINIPDIAVNPFETAGLMKPNPAKVEIGGKIYDVDEEAQADMDDVTPNMSVKQEFIEKPAEKRQKNAPESFNGDFGNDYGDYEEEDGPSAMDVARKSAILDTPFGAGPMEMLRARNAAMGTAYEEDDNGKMTGRMLFNNNGNVEVMGEGQDKQYFNDPQSFLKDVMSGTVQIGGTESGEGVSTVEGSGVEVDSPTYPAQDTDPTDAVSVMPFEEGNNTYNIPANVTEIPQAVIDGSKGLGEWDTSMTPDQNNPEYAAWRDAYLNNMFQN